MKNYARTISLGLVVLLESAGCGGSVSSAPPADGGSTDGASTAADGASTAADGASTPDTAIADSASTRDTAMGDETAPSADATGAQSGMDATLADASTGDATSPSIDATPTPDGTTAEDAPSSDDSAVSEGDSAASEGGSCEGFTTDNPSCDQCITENCCEAVAACNGGEDAGADDPGVSMCEQIISCVEDLCADGGVLGECIIGCSPDEVSPVDPLLTCIAESCPAECN
jgi:hypothetical protein